eukprot:SAG11_NODE_829_length_6967_cov_7.039196_3_plen_180_part_00
MAFVRNSGCDDALSTEGLPCHITQAMLWLGPFLTYANFLQRTTNRTVLLDVGLGIAFPGFPTDNVSASGVAAQRIDWLGSHRFHTELEAEKFLHVASSFIRGMQVLDLPRNSPVREICSLRAEGVNFFAAGWPTVGRPERYSGRNAYLVLRPPRRGAGPGRRHLRPCPPWAVQQGLPQH